MLTGVKDIDMIILNNLDDKDLVIVCRVNKYIDKICKDQTFWLNRILSKFPYLPMDILNKYKKDRSWSQYYINDLRKINTNNVNNYLVNGSAIGRLDYVIIALKMGANIHVYDDEAIRFASRNGHIDIVRYLVEAGANINVRGDYISTPIMLAGQKGHIDIVKYLVEAGADIHILNDLAIRWAKSHGHMDVVNYLKSLP